MRKKADRPELTTLDHLKPDPMNRRKRTARGARMLVESIGRVGVGRSIVIDETNEVIAGNGVIEAAAEVGLTKVAIVDVDGDTVVAVRRKNLTPEQKRSMALYDNRTGELAEWNADQLADDRRHGRDLEPFFDESELRKHLRTAAVQREPVVKELETGPVTDRFWISVRGPLASQALALQRLRELLRDVEGVDVELGTTEAVEAWGG